MAPTSLATRKPLVGFQFVSFIISPCVQRSIYINELYIFAQLPCALLSAAAAAAATDCLTRIETFRLVRFIFLCVVFLLIKNCVIVHLLADAQFLFLYHKMIPALPAAALRRKKN